MDTAIKILSGLNIAVLVFIIGWIVKNINEKW